MPGSDGPLPVQGPVEAAIESGDFELTGCSVTDE
jgi:hypothetical protein